MNENEKISRIETLLEQNNLQEVTKLLVGFDANAQPRNLNYLRAVFAIKIGDFMLANKALELELALYPDNDAAKRLRAFVAEPRNKFFDDKKEKSVPVLVNLGCGGNFRKGWINIDVASNSPDVIVHDLKRGIPLESESADFVYASHVLEHFTKKEAEKFIDEIYRVLKKGGIARIAVPDLEQIAREYLRNLESAKLGDDEARKRYEWIVLELLDQLTRNVSGGEMLKYWAQKDIPALDYVIERVGTEAENAIKNLRASGFVPSDEEPQEPCEIGRFRLSGEVHQWMYDEYSLGKLLRRAGFSDVGKTTAFDSRCAEFGKYFLDVTEEGKVRKPDSLFMEAVK